VNNVGWDSQLPVQLILYSEKAQRHSAKRNSVCADCFTAISRIKLLVLLYGWTKWQPKDKENQLVLYEVGTHSLEYLYIRHQTCNSASSTSGGWRYLACYQKHSQTFTDAHSTELPVHPTIIQKARSVQVHQSWDRETEKQLLSQGHQTVKQPSLTLSGCCQHTNSNL
jgi:hypothetical protein